MTNIGKIIGIILLVLGAVSLGYGGFTYTKKEAALDIGPVQVDVEKEHHVNVPVWGGVGAIVLGGLLLVWGGSRR